MMIKNFDKLATSALRSQALRIAEAGFEAINSQKAVRNALIFNARKNQLVIQKKKFNLAEKKKIIVFGIGKAALESVSELYKILGERISSGLVIDVKDGYISQKIICRTGTHPLLSEQNVAYSKEALGMLSDLTEEDLVITVISGGGSALFEVPHEISVEQETLIFKLLTKQGAPINELNTVRKHISQVKGGQLAKIIYPAAIINLIFSDVPGDDLSMVASGPTLRDSTSARDAQKVLHKYDIMKKANLPVCRLLETPKEEKFFKNAHNFLIVSAKLALSAMREKAEDLGFSVKIFSEKYQGEARELGKQIVEVTKSRQCLLGAGESTITIIGQGKGGRNQEMALGALPFIGEDQVLVALASDGKDNSDVAGAIVDLSTLECSRALGLDFGQFLNNNASFNFFEAIGGQVITGFTGSNVSDFFVCLKNT